MFKRTIDTINELIAKEVMAQVEGLTLEQHEESCWDWSYRKASSECYFESPIDAFIDFTKIVLEVNDKLTGGDISYDED